MGGKSRIATVLALLALSLLLGPQAGAVLYACIISGDVSSSCCCAPSSADGCAAIDRACSCCEISVSESTEGPVQAAIPSGISQFTPDFVPEPNAVLPVFIKLGAATTSSRASAPPAPLYILNASLLC